MIAYGRSLPAPRKAAARLLVAFTRSGATPIGAGRVVFIAALRLWAATAQIRMQINRDRNPPFRFFGQFTWSAQIDLRTFRPPAPFSRLPLRLEADVKDRFARCGVLRRTPKGPHSTMSRFRGWASIEGEFKIADSIKDRSRGLPRACA